MTQAVFCKLPDRAFIYVSGTDRFDFLQGLITQDAHLLKSQNLIYSCLLTPNGKFLFDFFVFEDNDQLVIDCEGGERANALLKRLSMFKLRSDVTLELADDVDVFQIFRHCEEQNDATIQNDAYFKDPRFDGYRAHPPMSSPRRRGSVSSVSIDSRLRGEGGIAETSFKIWDTYRIRAEIPDGSRDLIPEKSFLHESEIITKTAVSYDKGCYMGQELVSRMHHRGLVKKQLRCVEIDNIPENTELRSKCGDIGLALIKP